VCTKLQTKNVCSNVTCIEIYVDLDEDQSIELLAENTEENTNCLDNGYEQTENILNDIQLLQNIGGDSSIFKSKLLFFNELNLKNSFIL